MKIEEVYVILGIVKFKLALKDYLTCFLFFFLSWVSCQHNSDSEFSKIDVVDESNEPKKSTYFITTSGEDNRSQFSYYPRQNFGNDSIMLSCLHKLDSDTLILVDTLNYTSNVFTRLSYMRHFDEHKWFLWREKDVHPGPSELALIKSWSQMDFISVLDYSGGSIEIRHVNTDSIKPFSRSYAHDVAYVSGPELYFNYSAVGDKRSYSNFALEKNLKTFGEISEETYFRGKYSKYESGLFYRECHGLPFSSADHKLKFSYYKIPFKSWPDADLQLPDGQSNGVKFANFTVLYDTPESDYIVGSRYDFKGRRDSSGLVFLYNKSESIWDTLSLPNYFRTFNVYEYKLAYGTGFRDCISPDCNKRDSILSFIGSNPDKYSEKFGFTPSVANLTGVVFFLDLPSLTFTEITLSDIDSELLLIQDDFLYYRVYDKIYKSYIDIENPTIDESTSELLVQDREIVPNIHHMFLHGS